MKKLEHYFYTFMAGFLISALISLSTKYPLEVATLDKYKMYCHDSTVEKVKIGITGEVYYVKCANGYSTNIH